MKLSYFLLVLLFFLSSPHTHSQFSTCDIRGTTPTLPCNYCTLSPSITIGANSTLPPTPQTLSVGIYSTNLNLGTYSPSTTVATGPTAGPITIGVNTAVANTQSANYAQCSRYVQVAQGRPTCNAEFADFGQQVPTPFPTPTTFQQQCRVCSNSYYANFGTNSNQIEIAIGPTAGPITMGKTSTPSTQSVTINGASILVGSGPTAGPVAIGTTGTPSTQSVTVNGASIFLGSSASTTVQVAQGNCPTAYYGRFTSASPSQTLFIGENNPSPTPSPGQQCRICELSGVGTTLGSGSTAGPVTIGSPTSNPGQTVTVAESSGNLYLGRGSPTTKLTNVVVCQNTPSSSPVNQYCDIGQATTFIRMGESLIGSLSIATGTGSNNAAIYIGMAVPTGSPSGPPSQNQEVYLFEYSRNVRIAQKIPGQLQLGTDANSGVLIANGPTAGPITLGRTVPAGAPSLAGSNLVKLQGLYHYFYNAMCFGNTGGSAAVLNCNYANVRTNAAVGGAPTTSGYNTAENRWYPPEPGHYMITVMGLILPAQYGAIYVITAVGGTRQTQVYARTYNAVDYSTVTGTTIQTFNSIGSGNYIEMQGTLMWDDGGASGYNVLSITRVA